MKRFLRNGILIFSFTIFSVIIFTVWRNIQFDKGASALKSGDFDIAMQKLRPLAMIGDSSAQSILGQMYAFGWGVTKNDSQALTWFRKAGKWTETEPDKGASAAYYIGRDYEEGHGVYRDEREAVKWYQLAAKGGFRPAAELLGKAYAEGKLSLPRDPVLSEYWLNKAGGQ